MIPSSSSIAAAIVAIQGSLADEDEGGDDETESLDSLFTLNLILRTLIVLLLLGFLIYFLIVIKGVRA